MLVYLFCVTYSVFIHDMSCTAVYYFIYEIFNAWQITVRYTLQIVDGISFGRGRMNVGTGSTTTHVAYILYTAAVAKQWIGRIIGGRTFRKTLDVRDFPFSRPVFLSRCSCFFF